MKLLVNPAWQCPRQRRKRDTHTVSAANAHRGKGHARTRQEGGGPRAPERGLRRPQPCPHVHLGLPASRMETVSPCCGEPGRWGAQGARKAGGGLFFSLKAGRAASYLYADGNDPWRAGRRGRCRTARVQGPQEALDRRDGAGTRVGRRRWGAAVCPDPRGRVAAGLGQEGLLAPVV